MKKALSLFLVALLAFSLSVFPAYAADGDEDPLTAINNIIALWMTAIAFFLLLLLIRVIIVLIG